MNEHILSSDTQAILLLCGTLGQTRENYPKPLSATEYNNLSNWMKCNNLRPRDLLQQENIDRLNDFRSGKINSDRLHGLLMRGGMLAIIVESWTNKGLWIISLSDEGYPQRWIDRLNHLTPPLIYGVGNQDLLAKGGLAVVGSRDVDEIGTSMTRSVARLCANQSIQIISGGARGVDSEAMLTALAENGCVAGVLADSLYKSSMSKKYRQGLHDGRLVLVSPYDPGVAFNVGNAMGRNKLVYCLSDSTLVISTAFQKGGTWAGAVEDLNHKWVPLFVRSGNNVSEGNNKLIECGGIGIDDISLTKAESVKKLINGFGIFENKVTLRKMSPLSDFKPFLDSKEDTIISESCSRDELFSTAPEQDLFFVVWPNIEAELHTARTDKELAYIFNVQLAQMRSWLKQAVSRGIARKSGSPIRYKAIKEKSLNKWTCDN